MRIVFRFSAPKAAAAIQRMVQKNPGIDLHTALKACYFADKSHLNAEHRPIFGADYKAMRYGPVPLQIYEMIKGEAYWLAEIGAGSYPWMLEGYNIIPGGENHCEFDFDLLSDSDKEHFSKGIDLSKSMTFTDRTSATHGKDWQRANLGYIDYADMLEDSEDKPKIVEHLLETGRFMRL